MRRFLALVLATLVVVSACSRGGGHAPAVDQQTRFFYDGAGRLAAVRQGDIAAVYRFDRAGNRVEVDHVPSSELDPAKLRGPAAPKPSVQAVSPAMVAQGATVVIHGSGFDPDPTGDVVEVGADLGRVLSANHDELRVQLPPAATPGPVTVSTAYGRSTSRDDLVVVPAEIDPDEVDDVAQAEIGEALSLHSGLSLITFHGKAGSTVELHLEAKDSAVGGCEAGGVGLAGPTGTIVEADAGEDAWCDRPARLPMTGTYTAAVTPAVASMATIGTVDAASEGTRLPDKPVKAVATQTPDLPATDGPPGYPVDLVSGLMRTAVTDLSLGGSGAVDLTRTFSVGDPSFAAFAPEEPLARNWSLAGSLALEPSMSYSYLDLVMPDGRRLPFQRVTKGAPKPTGAVFEPSGGVGSGQFAGASVAYTGSGWELTTRAGTVLGFGRPGSPLRLSWIRDRAGRTARWVRAPDGELTGVVSETGQWARLVHDSEGRIATAIDQVGDLVSYTYGRPSGVYADVLTQVTYRRADGSPSTVGYRYRAVTGRLLAVTDGRRDRLRFGYDDAGRVTRQQVLGPVAAGERAGEWRYSYDVGSRRVRIPGRPGSVTLPQIDRVVVDAPGGRRTVAVRHGHRAALRASAGAGASGSADAGYVSRDDRSVFVDARGRIAATRDAQGDVTSLGYDAHDRPTSITDPDGETTRFGYTRSGELASVTDAAGTTRYGWNADGQQVSETDPLGHRQRWAYEHGRLLWSLDARGVRSTFGYDRAGRLATARYGVRPGVEPESVARYGYDRSGRLTSVRDSADGTALLGYDTAGRLVRETTGAGSVGTAYDENGRRTVSFLPGGVREEYGYDSKGRPGRLSLGAARVATSYDEKGRLSGLDLPNGVHGRLTKNGISYTRDGHLLAEQWATYDESGRVSGLTGDLARTALPAKQAETTFDAARQSVGWRWDAAGNLLQDDARRYSWDARGRLVGVSGPEGRTTFGYDALGRRTTATTAAGTVRYVYDGDDVVQQMAPDGTRTTYLRGPDGTPLASTTGTNKAVTALLPDVFGNIGAAVGPNGDTKRFAYDPFGVTKGTDSQPGFRGLIADPSGLMAMGARTYDPSSGRFLSRDSWGIEGGDTDPYRYGLGAPTVFTDPSGHAAECVGLALGWAMSALGPDGSWADYEALEDKVASGELSEDQWAVQADRVSHDLWSGFDVVANVCGTSPIGSSAAALPLLGAGKVTSRVLGSLADDAVEGAAATRVGSGFDELAPGVSLRARAMLGRLLARSETGSGMPTAEIANAKFAQRSFSERFSVEGAFGGRTIDDVAAALRSGALSSKEVAINVIIRDGTMLIANTRSAQVLIRAGIPRSEWAVVDQTGVELYERLLTGQLRRNRLGSSGVDLP